MIIEPKLITMAYRCRSCGNTVFGPEGALRLGGDMLKLKCDCGESELSVKTIPDDKVRITLPCVFCQNDHTFVISKKLLASKELFTYPCPYTGIDICFFGTSENIKQAAKSSDEELSELISDDEREAFSDMENKRPYESDEHIRDMIKFVLNDLVEEGRVYCDCRAGEIGISEGDDFVDVFCKKCGCSKRYFCVDSIQTNELFDASKIYLSKKGGRQ